MKPVNSMGERDDIFKDARMGTTGGGKIPFESSAPGEQ